MKPNKKRIAVIGLKGLPAFGGAAAVGENIIEQLKNSFDFTVYSISSHTHLESGLYKGYQQSVLSAIPHKKLNTLLYYIRVLFRVMFSNFDIVHLHHSDMAILIPILRLRHKVIVTTHGAHNVGITEKWSRFRWFFRGQMKFLKFANVVTCVSKKEKQWLFDLYGVEADYIPNGIELFSISGKDDYKSDIFFASGRIIKDKGCHTLLNALNDIRFTGKVLLAGDHTQSPVYTDCLKKLSSNLDITFLGMIKDKMTLLRYIKSSRLFVYPSEKEAMSMMLLEAASTSTPIICSNIVENRDVFSDDCVSFFENKSSSDLANKLKWAFDNGEHMQVQAQNAFSVLKCNHQWSAIADKYSNYYSRLV